VRPRFKHIPVLHAPARSAQAASAGRRYDGQMGTNVDERLLDRWLVSRARREKARAVLARSSLPAERFEGWALDLIAEALSQPPAGRTVAPPHDDAR
jgi:hypothetical protein